ncbi:hypothetical protein GCM10010404_74010 [Nonomuraea africana]|uniref:Drug/metabolite transporter (DMT)-like permease n=1 Tax=Nonomuraea africana TaxID=46171 RepID=A0ABR9K7U1_9ACTN|nr:hypothetical protein [Nonomuraea africana]MBE1557876.1 drug/metabolite transporter (DMT)-like permease [Nonomuraea africana]
MSIAIALLYLVPTVIVLVVGIVLTARARGSHGRGATLGLVGCVVLLVAALLQGAYQAFLDSLVQSGGYRMMATLAMISGLVFMVINVAGLGLLISGVVARRNGAQQPAQGWQQPYPPQPPYSQQPPPGQWPSR